MNANPLGIYLNEFSRSIHDSTLYDICLLNDLALSGSKTEKLTRIFNFLKINPIDFTEVFLVVLYKRDLKDLHEELNIGINSEKKLRAELVNEISLWFYKLFNVKSKIQDYKVTVNKSNPSEEGKKLIVKRDEDLSPVIIDITSSQPEAKKQLQETIAIVKFNRLRSDVGLKSVKNNFHCIFKGNAGTGKTEFAKWYSREIKQLGFLDKGHLVITSRSDLIGDHIGETAIKTKKKIFEALGGVLFIDEAYSLHNGKLDEFGVEAINELIATVENNRDNLIVILAGYNDEMENFLNVNQGLASRFPNIINFKDYTLDELIKIFKKFCDSEEFIYDSIFEKRLGQHIETLMKKEHFGNARTIRNLFELLKRKMALRIVDGDKITNEIDLKTFTLSEIDS